MRSTAAAAADGERHRGQRRGDVERRARPRERGREPLFAFVERR